MTDFSQHLRKFHKLGAASWVKVTWAPKLKKLFMLADDEVDIFRDLLRGAYGEAWGNGELYKKKLPRYLHALESIAENGGEEAQKLAKELKADFRKIPSFSSREGERSP